jgi:3-dehydroquinate dehydratase-2
LPDGYEPPTLRDPSGAARKILPERPNLNLLGARELESCGGATMSIICALVQATTGQGAHQRPEYSGEKGGFAFIFVNPAVFTLSRRALRETLAAVGIPFLEARQSNIHAPEALRRHAYFSDLAVGTICGLGSRGCDLALEYALTSQPRNLNGPGAFHRPAQGGRSEMDLRNQEADRPRPGIGIAELEITEGEEKVKIVKGVSGVGNG